MRKFIVFNDESFIDVERIVAVRYSLEGTRIYYDLVDRPVIRGSEDACMPYITVKEKLYEVKALIKKALGDDVSFTSGL